LNNSSRRFGGAGGLGGGKNGNSLQFPIKPSIRKYALVLLEGFSDPQSHLIIGAALKMMISQKIS